MTTEAGTSLPPTFFDDIYAQDPDPWSFATSEYENTKYAVTLAALPRAHYGSGLEIGCSIGVLTEQLAARCDTLLSLDVAERALARRDVRAAARARSVSQRVLRPDRGVRSRLLLVAGGPAARA
jgi:hypothetical protein